MKKIYLGKTVKSNHFQENPNKKKDLISRSTDPYPKEVPNIHMSWKLTKKISWNQDKIEYKVKR
jgi:V8-like Glu-specific endopeptidase